VFPELILISEGFMNKKDFHVLMERSPVGLRIEVGSMSILPHLHSSSDLCLSKARKALEEIISMEGSEKGPSAEIVALARNAIAEIEKATQNRSH